VPGAVSRASDVPVDPPWASPGPPRRRSRASPSVQGPRLGLVGRGPWPHGRGG